MSILDDIKKTIDDLLGVPIGEGPSLSIGADQSMGSDGGGDRLDLEGIMPMGDNPISYQGPSPNDLSVSESFALQQRRQGAFQVVDVTPFHVTADIAPCLVSQKQINDKVGYDGEGANENFDPIGVTPVKLETPWRTLVLDIQGTFLGIETLPVKMSGADTTPNAHDDSLYTVNEDQTANPQDPTFGSLAGPPDVGNQDFATRFFNYRVMNPVILIQFETTSAPILLARPGSKFNATFSKVFISFKTGAPRFSVVTGYKSSMEHGTKELNANPAFGPGYGLWDNPSRHCVPFCMGLPPVGSGPAGLYQNGHSIPLVTLNAGVSYTHSLFVFEAGENFFNPLYPTGGIALIWITGFTFSAYPVSGANVDPQFYFTIEIFNDNSNRTKTLMIEPFIPIFNVGANTAFGNIRSSRDFPTPIRATLVTGDRLRVRIETNQNMNFVGVVNGYFYGRPDIFNEPDESRAPESIQNNPFPLDLMNWFAN